MRRADRLFRIVQILRRDQQTRACDLAAELEVSDRTVYRDIRDLQASGVPIEGEAGVGYVLPDQFDLPPMMLNEEECMALMLGIRMVSGFADKTLRQHMSSAAAKIESVLSDSMRERFQASPLYAPQVQFPEHHATGLSEVKQAILDRHMLVMDYRDVNGRCTQRTVRPLGLFFWSNVWVLVAWCELRGAFRNFRLDRIRQFEVSEDSFEEESSKELGDYLNEVLQANWEPPYGV